MSRLLVALLFLFVAFSSAFSTVYPSDGPLFDVSNPQCAVGRPLNEVLGEVLSQTSIIKRSTDTLLVRTSSDNKKFYYGGTGENLNLSNIPTLSVADTVLYVQSNIHNYAPNGGKNDTVTVFGVSFKPGKAMSDRTVTALWFFSWTVLDVDTSRCEEGHSYIWKESCLLDEDEVALKSGPTYVNDLYFTAECPLPYKTYTFDDGGSVVVKTGNRIASVFCSGYGEGSDGVRVAKTYMEDYYIGNLNYCSDTTWTSDTICRKELDAYNENHGTFFPGSVDDTTRSTSEWGAMSVVITHLEVNEPSETVIDSVRVSDEVTEETLISSTETLVNAVGCDSVVIRNVTIIPVEYRDTSSYLPVIPDKFFTPNGDGVRELWNITNIDLYQKYTVRIYDRYGKVLKEYKGNFSGWDGVYNGYPQPSTDYWYSITIDEIDEELEGHFTLVR